MYKKKVRYPSWKAPDQYKDPSVSRFINQFPDSNEKAERDTKYRVASANEIRAAGANSRFVAANSTRRFNRTRDHPVHLEFGVLVHGLSVAARVGTKLSDVFESGHRIFLVRSGPYLIGLRSPRKATLVRSHDVIFSLSLFLSVSYSDKVSPSLAKNRDLRRAGKPGWPR